MADNENGYPARAVSAILRLSDIDDVSLPSGIGEVSIYHVGMRNQTRVRLAICAILKTAIQPAIECVRVQPKRILVFVTEIAKSQA